MILFSLNIVSLLVLFQFMLVAFYTLMNLSIILYPIIMTNISFQLFKTFFTVDMNSGVVTQTMTLDRETMATHSFMVKCAIVTLLTASKLLVEASFIVTVSTL